MRDDGPEVAVGEEVAGAARPLPAAKIVVALAVQAVVMTLIGFALWRWSGRDGAAYVTWSVWQLVTGLALGGALIAVAWAVFAGFPRIGESLVRMQAKTYGFIGGQLGLPAIVAISLCAGIGEEALFRGGIQTYLSDLVGEPGAIALSSAAFAAIHLARPMISVMLFVIGGLFGVIYWQTGSLLVVMLGHALYDVWALRYLLNEFVRLGLVDQGPPGALAKPAAGS